MKTNTTFAYATVFNIAGEVDYASGGIVSKQIIKEQGLSEHTAPFDALVQILDGEVEIHVGGIPHRLKAGEIIIMPANVPHALHAVERFKMLLTMIKGENNE